MGNGRGRVRQRGGKNHTLRWGSRCGNGYPREGKRKRMTVIKKGGEQIKGEGFLGFFGGPGLVSQERKKGPL